MIFVQYILDHFGVEVEAVLLRSKSIADIELIITLAKKLGIEICKINESNDVSLLTKAKSTPAKHNFLNSKGLWRDRSIDAESLRKEAWKIQN